MKFKIIKSFIFFNFFYVSFCSFIFPTSTRLHIGDSCEINNNLKGICTVISQCSPVIDDLRQNIFNHKLCGFCRNEEIVCCPPTENHQNDHVVQRIADLPKIREGYQCIVNGSTESGIFKTLKNCPEIEEKVKNGVPIPSVCDFEVCRDIVCCPYKKSYRIKNYCTHIDDPDDDIILRLETNSKCVNPITNITGHYENHCSNILDNGVDVCDRDVCSFWHCCPNDESLDKDSCNGLNLNRLTQTTDIIGPKCVDSKTGLSGTCRIQDQCNAFKLNNETILEECGTSCCAAFYCCPDDDTLNIPISQQKCGAYRTATYTRKLEVTLSKKRLGPECKGGSGFVAGGYFVSPGDYPHMAAIGYYMKRSQIEWNCGGSLISDRYVLTAGHCLMSRELGPPKVVRLGAIHLTNLTATKDCPEDFDIAKLISYPTYHPKYVYNDIALIFLDRVVSFNFHIRPICLPADETLPDQFSGMGWGAVGAYEDKSERLLQIQLDLFSYSECNSSYKLEINRRFLDGLDEVTQICAGSKYSIQSTCSGDSGGPIISFHKAYPKMHILYGVTSFGRPCGFENSPDVYTKVYPYVPWIESIVWPRKNF